MSQQDNGSNVNGNECLANLPFVKIFTKGGFRAAVQPGKLMLAAAGIILIFMAGWLLDAMTPSGARVMSLTDASGRTTTELEAYVNGAFTTRQDFAAFCDHIQMVNEQQLKAVLMAPPLMFWPGGMKAAVGLFGKSMIMLLISSATSLKRLWPATVSCKRPGPLIWDSFRR